LLLQASGYGEDVKSSSGSLRARETAFGAGTLPDDFHPAGGALYRLEEKGRMELMRGQLTISNGLGWSPDGANIYLTDSGPRVVHAFSFNAAAGTVSDDRLLTHDRQRGRNAGWPDG
jgi:sugar lactone lactonase YvrE